METKPHGPLIAFLRAFFFLLYQPMAWSYDLVAWAVSLGRWKDWVYTTLPYLSGPRVLELGHGPGHLQVALDQKGADAFGLDLSPQMGRQAARRLFSAGTPAHLVRGRAQRMPFKSASFNQLVSTFPSEYIFDPQTLAESYRVLTPGGRFVVLPVAWLRGTGLLERLMACLFRATGQANDWTGLFSSQLKALGYTVQQKHIQAAGGDLIQVIAEKP